MDVFVKTSIFSFIKDLTYGYKPQASREGLEGIQHVHKGVQVNLTRLFRNDAFINRLC
jgi:hypothetical protein